MFSSADLLDRDLHVDPRREDLLRRHQAARNALFMRVTQEEFERCAVFLDAIRVIVTPEGFGCGFRRLAMAGKCDIAGTEQPREAALPRFIEGIVKIARNPGVV